MAKLSEQLPRYNVRSLLRITLAMAAVFATLRLLGPRHSWTLFLVCYAFAPTLALLSMALLRKHSKQVRYIVAGLMLFCFVLGITILCGVFYGADAMVFALIGTGIEWPGQIGVLVCLQLMVGKRADWKMEDDLPEPTAITQ